MSSLYESLGGKDAVEIAVDKFYEKVLADDRISHFFDGVDMEKQRGHQKAFLTLVFGGPDQLNNTKTSANMRTVHKNLVEEKGLNEDHFNAVIENFVATLQELNVPEELIQEVGAIAGGESHKNDVLNR